MTLATYIKQFDDAISQFRELSVQIDALTAAAAVDGYFITVRLRDGVEVNLPVQNALARDVITDEIARLKTQRRNAFATARTAATNIAGLL